MRYREETDLGQSDQLHQGDIGQPELWGEVPPTLTLRDEFLMDGLAAIVRSQKARREKLNAKTSHESKKQQKDVPTRKPSAS